MKKRAYPISQKKNTWTSSKGAIENSKKDTRLVMINADWRDFQGTPALEEDEEAAILIIDYGILMRKAGWAVSHVMQAPMSSERFLLLQSFSVHSE